MMNAVNLVLTEAPAGFAGDDLRSRLRRILLPGERSLAELDIRSPRDGVYLATAQRVIFIINERIGYRMGCVPHEDVLAVEHIRQRSTNMVHILHTAGKLLLTSTDDRAVRSFVAAVRRNVSAMS